MLQICHFSFFMCLNLPYLCCPRLYCCILQAVNSQDDTAGRAEPCRDCTQSSSAMAAVLCNMMWHPVVISGQGGWLMLDFIRDQISFSDVQKSGATLHLLLPRSQTFLEFLFKVVFSNNSSCFLKIFRQWLVFTYTETSPCT